MDAILMDLVSLVIRWLHVIAGIAWIGASFYFIWLDNSLQPPAAGKAERGVKGELWAFHGGGIYEVAKYAAAPPAMPNRLHWFYWEAYATWMTGMLLLVVVYYLQAQGLLVNQNGPLSGAAAAIAASLSLILLAVAVYEGLMRSGIALGAKALAAVALPLLCAYSYGLGWLFSGRAAYIHLGIALGTIMVANVFFGIIPAQRRFVAQIEAGEAPDATPLARAKLRSTHNNYMTLPVLFCMISAHHPLLYGHRHAWLILVAIALITGVARHYFNLRHKGIAKPAILAGCALAFAALVLALLIDRAPVESAAAAVPDDAAAMSIVAEHCTVCHAPAPSHSAYSAPPGGMVFAQPNDLAALADQAILSLRSRTMPLGNLTGMSERQRQQLLAWLQHLNAPSTAVQEP